MTPAAILESIRAQKALVVGDICLDRWCTYDPSYGEASRETGIPRLAVVGTTCTPGAGGTIANNLVALGTGMVAVLGAIGNDGHGWELCRELKARGVRNECIASDEIATFTYTKFWNGDSGEEDRPRADFINVRPMPAGLTAAVATRLEELAAEFDVILVSDQAETETGGVVSEALREVLGRLGAADPNKVIWVDSRLRPEHFRNAIIKPNESEAQAAMARAGLADYRAFRDRTQAPLLIVTHGDRGALLVGDEEQWVPGFRVQSPVDICGAGDSFSAGASLAYSVTRDAVASVRFGNAVASITIMKKGTGTASPEEVLAAFRG